MAEEKKNEALLCPCCGKHSFNEAGTYEICPVCGWEDDPKQRRDEALAGGANELSLREAKAAWAAKK